MGVITGWESTEKEERSEVQPVTANRVAPQRHALDVVGHVYAQLVSGDSVEADSTTSVINATAHSAKVGDVIRFDDGVLVNQEFTVLSTTTNSITLGQHTTTAPSAGDLLSVLRYTTPTVDAEGNPVITQEQYAIRYDDVGGGVAYFGKALPGTATSSALWSVRRITEADSDITIEWADGDSMFNNIWDNRAALSYS